MIDLIFEDEVGDWVACFASSFLPPLFSLAWTFFSPCLDPSLEVFWVFGWVRVCWPRDNERKEWEKKKARTSKAKFLSFLLCCSRPNTLNIQPKIKPPPNKDQGKEKGRFKQGRKEEEGRRKQNKQHNLQPHLQESSLSCACCHFKVGCLNPSHKSYLNASLSMLD